MVPWLGILGNIIGIGKDALSGWQERKAVKQEHEAIVEKAQLDAKIRRIQSGDDHAASLDKESIKQRGWKDEYLLLLTTLPLVLLFTGPLIGVDFASKVSEGFTAMSNTPEYYWYALGMVYIDTFGFRRMVRVAFEHWLNKTFGGSNGR